MALDVQFDRVTTSLQNSAPKLLVVVDTEEEFDWSRPHSRTETNVTHVRHLGRAHAVFERYGLRPTYVVDYPVASQESAYKPLREWLIHGQCQIGAHLHPWVNPPFEEEVSARNSYPGNLPPALEKEKLRHLTRTIEANFGCRPTIYRAGRYGLGPRTGAILEELGYAVDTSVVPLTNFSDDGGPDFTSFELEPFWFGPSRRILELPLTVAWYGRLRRFGGVLQPLLLSDRSVQLHLPGILARSGLLERIRLTPEGTNFSELKRLTDMMLAAGNRLFIFSFHSPSVVPGNTPYVRDQSELEGFLGLLEKYCEYFLGACGGKSGTPQELRALCSAATPHPGTAAT